VPSKSISGRLNLRGRFSIPKLLITLREMLLPLSIANLLRDENGIYLARPIHGLGSIAELGRFWHNYASLRS
jgi:hypothetical protein